MGKGLGMGSVGDTLILSGTAIVVEDQNNRRTIVMTIDDIDKNKTNSLKVSNISTADLPATFQDGERVIVTLNANNTVIKKG